MSRYIDAEQIVYTWLIDNDGKEHDGVTLQSVIDMMPTADVVDVVRCKDCKYFDKDENASESWRECVAHFGKYFAVDQNDFCSYGERADT